MPPEAVVIDLCPRVGVGALFQQPLENVPFVEIRRQMQPRPTGKLVGPRQHQLRVGQLRPIGRHSAGMVLRELRGDLGVAGGVVRQQIAGLVLELFEIGIEG